MPSATDLPSTRRPGLQALRRRLAQTPGSLALPAAAALAGLLLAGVGLVRRPPPPIQSIPPGYAALVNGKSILMSDYMAQTMEVTGASYDDVSPAVRAKVLRDMINEELLVQRGVVLDLPETTTEVRDVMVAAVNTQVAQPVLAEPVSDEQLKAWYTAHRNAYTTEGAMDVTDLVLHVGGYENANQTIAQAETDASEAAYQLRSGADLRYIMDHFGFVDSHRTSGLELDFGAKIHLGAQLFNLASTMQDGQVSDPVTEPDGLHVLIMNHRDTPRPAAFDAVRNKVYQDYRDARRQRADQQNIALLRRDARILIAPGLRE